MLKNILIALLILAVVATSNSLPALAQISNFTSIVLSSDLSVGDDATVVDQFVSADMTATDDATVTDDLTVGSDVTITPQTVITITQAATLSPTGSYQQLTAAGAVSFGAITAGTAGDLLTLVNIGSNTITITDTGTLKLTGNLALGQYDSATLLSDGTNWIQLATANN